MRASSLPRAAIFVALLALAGSALPAPSAEAQTTTVPQHVSNLGQSGLASPGDLNHVANSFTTGGTTRDVFAITSVVLDVSSVAANVNVGIYTSKLQGGVQVPNLRIGGFLVRQGSNLTNLITFNAPPGGISLVGGTKYWLRSSHPSDNSLHRTGTVNEDADSTEGWSIGNRFWHSTDLTSWIAGSFPLRFRINATGAPPVDRTVNALADAWGLTESAPASEPEDAWDGSARGCRHNGRGYYNLAGAPARWHGLGMGCHTHGQGHHEHGREKH